MKKMKKGLSLLLVLLCLAVVILPNKTQAASQWNDLGSGWRIRLDPPHDGGKHGKWHVHVENNDGSIKAAENVDGSKHDNKSLDNLPKKVKEKAKNSKDYKKGKENQTKTDAAKLDIKRKGLNWKNVFHVIAILAILALFGLAVYFTGGGALAIFA